MAETYPTALPGILINSDAYTNQTLTRKNELSSGPPTFRLKDDNGWVNFDVSWKYTAAEMQLFRNWYRWTLANGSKLFEIGISVEGRSSGAFDRTPHDCYFDGAYRAVQDGPLFIITATLIAIEQKTLDEDSGISLVNAYAGFEDVGASITQLDDIVALIEGTWIP